MSLLKIKSVSMQIKLKKKTNKQRAGEKEDQQRVRENVNSGGNIVKMECKKKNRGKPKRQRKR